MHRHNRYRVRVPEKIRVPDTAGKNSERESCPSWSVNQTANNKDSPPSLGNWLVNRKNPPTPSYQPSYARHGHSRATKAQNWWCSPPQAGLGARYGKLGVTVKKRQSVPRNDENEKGTEEPSNDLREEPPLLTLISPELDKHESLVCTCSRNKS